MLFGLLFISLAYLAIWITQFGLFSLQMDFASFYTAGESLNYQQSPYENLVAHTPPIWDGINLFVHSRFLYPPLVATIFRLLALFPYSVAKFIWMLSSLCFLALAIWVARPIILADPRPEAVLLIGIFACWYYPVLPFLERGQIDSVTLLLLIIGIRWMIQRKHRVWAGFLFAIAILLKLHTIFLIPALVLQKKWHTLAGCGLGCLTLIGLSFVWNGAASTGRYFSEELPRIAVFGSGGDETMLLPNHAFRVALKGVPHGLTQKGGKIYSLMEIAYTANTTLVSSPVGSILLRIFRAFGIQSSITLSSAVIYTLFFSILVGWELAYKFRAPAWKETDEAGYWFLIMVVILLSAPLTWVMNTIWLIPIAGLAMTYGADQRTAYPPHKPNMMFFIANLLIGLLCLALPDRIDFPTLPYWLDRLAFYKYTIGEVSIFIGLLSMLIWKRKAAKLAA